MTLEYAPENLDALSQQILKVLCDSQSAVGILTLNWKDTSYRDVTRDIKKASTLLEQSGVQVEIIWAPGHSSIAGNEEADKLAKRRPMKQVYSQMIGKQPQLVTLRRQVRHTPSHSDKKDGTQQK